MTRVRATVVDLGLNRDVTCDVPPEANCAHRVFGNQKKPAVVKFSPIEATAVLDETATAASLWQVEMKSDSRSAPKRKQS